MELTDSFISYRFIKMPKVSPIENIDYYYLLITDIGFFHANVKDTLPKKQVNIWLECMSFIKTTTHMLVQPNI